MKNPHIKNFSMAMISLSAFFCMGSCDNGDSGDSDDSSTISVDDDVIGDFLLNVVRDEGSLNESSDILAFQIKSNILSIRGTQYNYSLDNSSQGVLIYNLSGGDLDGSATGSITLTDINRSWIWLDSLGRDLSGSYTPITR